MALKLERHFLFISFNVMILKKNMNMNCGVKT